MLQDQQSGSWDVFRPSGEASDDKLFFSYSVMVVGVNQLSGSTWTSCPPLNHLRSEQSLLSHTLQAPPLHQSLINDPQPSSVQPLLLQICRGRRSQELCRDEPFSRIPVCLWMFLHCNSSQINQMLLKKHKQDVKTNDHIR